MLDGNTSASAAIGNLRAAIQARLEQNEDFRALRALEKALAEVTRPRFSPGRQVTPTQGLPDPATPPVPPAKQPNGSPAQTSAASSSITGLSGDSLRFG